MIYKIANDPSSDGANKRVYAQGKRQVWWHVNAKEDLWKKQYVKSSESRVAHVRPHGRNSNDKLPLPDGRMMTKQCFWLNGSYIAQQVSKNISKYSYSHSIPDVKGLMVAEDSASHWTKKDGE